MNLATQTTSHIINKALLSYHNDNKGLNTVECLATLIRIERKFKRTSFFKLLLFLTPSHIGFDL